MNAPATVALSLVLCLPAMDCIGGDDADSRLLYRQTAPERVERYGALGDQDARRAAKNGSLRFYSFHYGWTPPPEIEDAKKEQRLRAALGRKYKIEFLPLPTSELQFQFPEYATAYQTAYNLRMLQEVHDRFGTEVARMVKVP